MVDRRGGASRGHRRAGGKPAVRLLPLPHSSVLSCAVVLHPAQGTVRGGFLITRKPRRVCRPQAAKNSRAIFSLDMCVRENTSQSASVEFVRHWRANYARSRLQAFCRKNHRFFRQSQEKMSLHRLIFCTYMRFLRLYAAVGVEQRELCKIDDVAALRRVALGKRGHTPSDDAARLRHQRLQRVQGFAGGDNVVH